MATCDVCGERVDLPHQCNQCDEVFCGSHRLPEAHDCSALADWGRRDGFGRRDERRARQDQSQNRDQNRAVTPASDERSDGETALARLGGILDGNVTFVYLALMASTLVAQTLVLPLIGNDLATWSAIFVLSTDHPEYVWTWITSVFAHGGLFHLFFNGVFIFFFGRLVEEYVGWKQYSLFFVGSGAIAGLAQVGVIAARGIDSGVLGASGAVYAIMGALLVINPRFRAYLFFFLPLPFWIIASGYGLMTVWYIQQGGPAAGGVGHVAHLSGLIVGLIYGLYVKGSGGRLPDELRLGGERRI